MGGNENSDSIRHALRPQPLQSRHLIIGTASTYPLGFPRAGQRDMAAPHDDDGFVHFSGAYGRLG
eukprot:1701796-Pyramimonas_sp.AAC.1